MEVITTGVTDSHNLYFMNGVDQEGFEPDEPGTDVFADPLLMGRTNCDLTLGEGSPAFGAGPDGSTIGGLQ